MIFNLPKIIKIMEQTLGQKRVHADFNPDKNAVVD
jgi:hypothetical protein